MAAYNIRSLVELSKAARGYFTGAIQGAVASVFPNNFTVTAKVLALLDFEHELRRRYLYDQLFASSASDWLDRHGFELGLTQRPAATALGSITITASAGYAIPAGLTFARDDGATFSTLGQTIATGGVVTLAVAADTPGAAANTAAGVALALVDLDDAPPGLGLTALVAASGITGGADDEGREAFRARILARKRNPPQGGAAGDYVTWGFEALASVVSVYVDSFVNDSRSVWLSFTVDDQPLGIPTTGQVAAVQAYVDDPIRRPVTARVFVVAPIADVIPIVIGGLSPDSLDIRAAIAVELAAAFTDRAQVGKPSVPFLLSRSWIEEAISRATGEDAHRLVSPATDLVVESGHVPVLGAISYVA